MNTIENKILKIVEEYSSRGLPLSAEDILLFLGVHVVSRDTILEVVGKLKENGVIAEYGQNGHFFHVANFLSNEDRLVHYKKKIQTVAKVLDIVARIPFIRFVGVTGSGELEYMKRDDDVDIVVVVKKGTLFTTRVLIMLILILFGKKRSKLLSIQANSICLNLLLEEDCLRVPFAKRTLFSAKEIAKIRCIYDPKGICENLMLSNFDWVKAHLPNYKPIVTPFGVGLQTSMSLRKTSVLEVVLAFLQLWYMKQGVTNEVVTHRYLFLHPNIRRK